MSEDVGALVFRLQLKTFSRFLFRIWCLQVDHLLYFLHEHIGDLLFEVHNSFLIVNPILEWPIESLILHHLLLLYLLRPEHLDTFRVLHTWHLTIGIYTCIMLKVLLVVSVDVVLRPLNYDILFQDSTTVITAYLTLSWVLSDFGIITAKIFFRLYLLMFRFRGGLSAWVLADRQEIILLFQWFGLEWRFYFNPLLSTEVEYPRWGSWWDRLGDCVIVMWWKIWLGLEIGF